MNIINGSLDSYFHANCLYTKYCLHDIGNWILVVIVNDVTFYSTLKEKKGNQLRRLYFLFVDDVTPS